MFVFALPAAGKTPVEWIGYQRTMVVGLVLMASGALLFVPAASVATYTFFLCAEVVLAAGVTILQVAANPYVTILGPPETASQAVAEFDSGLQHAWRQCCAIHRRQFL